METPSRQANRCVNEVARSHAVSWLGEPAPTPVLGIDEVRFGRPRWVRDEQTGRWRRTDPWATRFVDLATGQGLLGQMPGRTSAGVRRWRAARAPEFRAAIRVVALDPSAPYTHAVARRCRMRRSLCSK